MSGRQKWAVPVCQASLPGVLASPPSVGQTGNLRGRLAVGGGGVLRGAGEGPRDVAWEHAHWLLGKSLLV